MAQRPAEGQPLCTKGVFGEQKLVRRQVGQAWGTSLVCQRNCKLTLTTSQTNEHQSQGNIGTCQSATRHLVIKCIEPLHTDQVLVYGGHKTAYSDAGGRIVVQCLQHSHTHAPTYVDSNERQQAHCWVTSGPRPPSPPQNMSSTAHFCAWQIIQLSNQVMLVYKQLH